MFQDFFENPNTQSQIDDLDINYGSDPEELPVSQTAFRSQSHHEHDVSVERDSVNTQSQIE